MNSIVDKHNTVIVKNIKIVDDVKIELADNITSINIQITSTNKSIIM